MDEYEKLVEALARAQEALTEAEKAFAASTSDLNYANVVIAKHDRDEARIALEDWKVHNQ